MQKRIIIIVVGWFWGFGVLAQDMKLAYVVVNKITIEGNSKTKEKVFTRELTFAVGDTLKLETFSNKLEENRKRLTSTGLFTLVTVNVKDWGADNRVTVAIKVLETWYIYPAPTFQFADRNFNVFWNGGNPHWNRINYGMLFTYNNFRGLQDPLTVTLQGGYTPKVALSYSLPFINKAQTIGIGGSVGYSQNTEVNYGTSGNKQLFIRDTVELKPYQKEVGGDVSMTYRPGLYSSHVIDVGYRKRNIAGAVAALNPDFYTGGQTEERFWSLYYGFADDHRDEKFYPKKGYYLGAYISKDGLVASDNVNDLLVGLRLGKFFTLSDRWSFEALSHLQTNLVRGPRPYRLDKALGYGSDFLRGYEYYVVDGPDFGFLKSTLRYEFFRTIVDFKKSMPVKQFRLLPISTYLTFNNDLGYANNPYNVDTTNTFNNRLLYSYGMSLNFVFAYDIVIKVDYSVNHLNQGAVYLRFTANF